jgi:hypothetical protein
MKKEPDLRQQQAQMAIQRQRLLTLCFGDMETVRLVSVQRVYLVSRSDNGC